MPLQPVLGSLAFPCDQDRLPRDKSVGILRLVFVLIKRTDGWDCSGDRRKPARIVMQDDEATMHVKIRGSPTSKSDSLRATTCKILVSQVLDFAGMHDLHEHARR